MGGNRVDASGSSIRRVGDVVFGADEVIARWVQRKIPGFRTDSTTRALGIIANGKIVAGVTFDGWNGIHVECAIAAEPGEIWLSRSTLHSIFYYPFITLGCEAISVSVPGSNLASLNLATKLGFEPEAIIKFAAPDCSPLIVLKAFRNNCRWIDLHGKKEL